MPKFNPIFTFSKINLKLTKKSSCFIFSNYFIKKLLEFYIVSSIQIPFSHLSAISVLPAAHREDVCDCQSSVEGLSLPVY